MRGFTLIELLAVIVILAIILIIAVPVINNIIEGVKKSAFESSVKNIVKSGEYTFASNITKPRRELVYTFTNKIITGNHPDATLDFLGEIPISGNLIIREDGKIAASLFNGEYCASKEYNTSEVVIVDKGIDDCYSAISLPEIVLNGTTPVNVEINTSYNDIGVIARTIGGDVIDEIDVKIIKNNLEVPSIDTSLNGLYKIIYTVNEGAKTNYVEREVNIVDTTKPILTVPLSTSIVIGEVNTFDFLSGVSVTDNSLEILTINVSGSISRIAGSYAITYSATDASGNTEEVIRMINVNDISAPVITLNGASTININVNGTYTELNATSLDDADGDLTSSIVKSGSVNTSVPGTYFITYTSKDSSNNESSATRTINIIDNINPIVNFGTNGNATFAQSRNTTVTVTDNVSVTNRHYQWTTSITAPTSGSFSQSFTNGATLSTPALVTGGYYLWIKAIDSSGNEVITRSNVFNIDNTAPVVTSIVSAINDLTPSSFTITRSGNATDAHIGLATNPYIYQTSLDNTNWTTRCTNNTTSCAVSGLTVNTTYYYRICAIDSLGNQSCIVSKSVVAMQSIADFGPSMSHNFTIPVSGTYKLEVWGAQGGNTTRQFSSVTGVGGKGGYATGTKYFAAGTVLRIIVGGVGTSTVYYQSQEGFGGFNGGGYGHNSAGGGGGTDIRQNGFELAHRIIVAGGGGGATLLNNDTPSHGGHGGGLSGVAGNPSGYAGTQTAGGLSGGVLGFGGSTSTMFEAGGGGGGYYGGGSGHLTYWAGGGGSSYLGSLASASTIAGDATMPNPAGGTMTGKTGSGYARITFLY